MRKIAIIDDDLQSLEGMREVIPWGEMDCQWVGEARDGQLGLELIRNVKPDIVITDIYMPVMNGLRMIEELRNASYQGKIIILSGYSDFEYARQALRLHVDDYLSKPVTVDEIVDVLEKTIGSHGNEIASHSAGKPRCQPAVPSANMGCRTQKVGGSRHKKTVDFMIRYAHDHYAKDITLDDLSVQLYLSRNYLNKIFKEAVGETFTIYMHRVRMEQAVALINEGSYLIYEIAEKVGYKNIPYFSAVFKKYFGMNPSDI